MFLFLSVPIKEAFSDGGGAKIRLNLQTRGAQIQFSVYHNYQKFSKNSFSLSYVGGL